MERSRASRLMVLACLLCLTMACGRTTGLPETEAATANESQRTPFDHESQTPEVTPSESNGPAASQLPAGTPVTIRLRSGLSSALVHASDTFEGTLDDPIVVRERQLFPRGTIVTGRLLAAKAAGHPHDPGYLRIALVSLTLDGKPIAIETSSLFVKGGARDRSEWVGSRPVAGNAFLPEKKEASLEAGRRLTFRLAQALELH